MSHSPKVLKARARLLLKSAFFGAVLVSSPMVARPDIPTAATDMRSIFYNPDWFEPMPFDEIIGVLAHEVMHIVLEHGLRRQGRDPVLWNIACDFAINLILVDCGFKLPDGGCLDQKYVGLAAEQIYDLLLKDPPPPGGGNGRGGNDPHKLSGIGNDLLEPGSMTVEEARELRDDLRQKVAQAAQMGRMAGNMPSSLKRAIHDVLHPPVPWEDLLRPMVRSIAHDDETWSRRNRRFPGVYLPSMHSERVGTVVVIGDTSGSITNDELRKMGGSVIDITEEVRPQTIHVLWADKQVAGEQVFDYGDLIALDPKGGGGTDMRVPLARAAELEPDVVVLLTDGYTPWPTDVPYPLIVCCTTETNVPIGEVVRI